MLTMCINHTWAANGTEIVPESQNKDTFFLQTLFKARDSPYIDAPDTKYETVPHEDYPVLGNEISDNTMYTTVRETSHRISRSTSSHTYPNRVTYVASNKGKTDESCLSFVKYIQIVARIILKS